MSTMDTDGVWNRGCTRATLVKNRPSSAMAKKMRGAVSIDPSSVLNVATITTTAMIPTPKRPTSSCAASAATSGECAICAIGRRYR